VTIRKKNPAYARLFAFSLLTFLLISACGGESETTLNTYPAAPTFEQLANLRYPTVFAKGSAARLEDGLWRSRVAHFSNRVYASIRLADSYAAGDLDGDGAPDAAVVLVSSPGEVGAFLELQAVLNKPEGLRPAASAYLTELAEVGALEIEAGEIKVTIQREGGEEMILRYRLEGDRLIEIR